MSNVTHGQDSLLSAIFPIVDQRVHYERIEEIKDVTQNLLFQRGKIWILVLKGCITI